MVVTGWNIRSTSDIFDPYESYGSDSSLFTLKIFHGGVFISNPVTTYVDGKISNVDLIDTDAFSVHEVNAMIQELGYSENEIMYYHYRIPEMQLSFGLRRLGNDEDVLSLLKFVPKFRIIELYIEHWVSRLAKLNQSPSKVVIEDLSGNDVNVQPKAKKLKPVRNANLSKKIHLLELNGSKGKQNHDPIEDGDDNGQIGADIEIQVQNDKGKQIDDPIEDVDNMVEDVEVDMGGFKDYIAMNYIDEENPNEHENDDELEDDEVDLDDFDSGTDEEDPLITAVNRLRKRKKKDMNVDASSFYVGQAIKSKEILKKLVKEHAVTNRRQLFISKNDKLRFRVLCKGVHHVFVGSQASNVTCSGPESSTKEQRQSCPWTLHVTRKNDNESWVVKTFVDNHNCLKTRKVRLYTVSTIAIEIESLVDPNPGIPIKVLHDLLQKKYQVEISLQKVFRAKVMATQKLQGDYTAQYLLLRDYCEELRRSNPGTTALIDVENECNPSSESRQFKRVYICYQALKDGFKQLGREVLGLDGCFMKGPFPGQILTAVGVDGNNCIYPVAFAIVESETFDSWTWFLENLGDDLGLNVRSNFTFISDRQKGIIPAIKKVYPSAEHRFCLRHIHENMKVKWKGSDLKEFLWKAASATTVQEYTKCMTEIKNKDSGCHQWLQEIPSEHWARSHFSGRAKSDVLLNNLCEVFNRQLIDGRDKPIVTCLEFIREYMMKRIGIVNKMIAKANGPLTPTATKTFNIIKENASQCNVIWNGQNKYQVNGFKAQYVIDVSAMTCTCRKWELTGMPCKHAVAVNWDMASNGLEVGIPETWVDKVYWLDTWKKVYTNTIDPINGKDMWIPLECPTSLLPPKHHNQIGRPKKARKKSAEELAEKISIGGKMTRKGKPVTCKICGEKGHNKRGCSKKSASTSTQAAARG